MASTTKPLIRVRPHLLPLLVWTAFCLIFFAAVLGGVQRFPDGDFSGQFYAFAKFQAGELVNGRFPLYSPGSYGGYPFAADSQSAVFYPIRWLTIALGQPYDSPYYLLQLEGIFHIWLTGIFTYLLAFDITHRRRAAAIAAAAFGLSGYLTSYPLVQLGILEAITWLPLALFALRRVIISKSNNPVRWLIAAALALAMSGLTGHIQTFFHASFVAAAYYIFLMWRGRWAWRWAMGLGFGLFAAVIGTLMVAWLPVLRYVADSNRSAVSYDFVSTGFPLQDYLQLFLPATLTYWSPPYVGIVTLLLAALAWFGRRLGDKKEVLFWAMMVLFAGVLSLGDNGIIFEFFYHTVPGFSLFRQQERWVFLVSLGLALLAAQGMAVFLQNPLTTIRPLLKKAAALIIGGLLLAALLLAFISDGAWLATFARQLLMLAAGMGLLWMGKRWGITAVILLVFLDLSLSIHSSMHLQDGSPAVYWPELDWIVPLQADQPARFDSQQMFPINLGEAYGVEDIHGISPIKPNHVARFEELPHAVRWQLLNVTHVLATDPFIDGMTAIAPITRSPMPDQPADATLYRYDNALPRAWMVYETIPVTDAEAALAALKNPAFQADAQAVIVQPLPIPIAPANDPPHVETHRPANGRLHIETDSQTDGLLVISEWDYPGWTATVDGRSVDLLTVNYALLGVPLAAGAHTVELAYRPVELPIGLALTAVTLILATLIGWRWRPSIPVRTSSVRSAKKTERRLRGRGNSLGAITAVILLGYGLRLYQLGGQELRGSEALRYLTTPFGNSEFGLRYPLLLLSLLLIPLLYQAGRRLTLPYLPIVAAWLAAISPALVRWGQGGAARLLQEESPELAQHLTAVGIEFLTGSALGWTAIRWLWLLTVSIALYGGWQLWQARQARRRWAVGLGLWLALPALFSFLFRYSGGDGYIYDLMIIALPAWLLLLSVGLVTLATRGRWYRAAAMALLFVLTAVSFLSLYRQHTDSHQPGYHDLVAYLATETAVNDIILTTAPDPALDYYLADLPITHALTTPESVMATPYNRIWLLSPPDGDAAVRTVLDDEMVLIAKRPFSTFTLRGYQSPEAAEMMVVNGRLPAENITLERAFMTVNGRYAPFTNPITLPANADVEITLVWSATVPVGDHYTAFVHLLAADGFLIAQHDGIPHDGLRPTETWTIGEQIIDKHHLTIPAEATGTLTVGLYNAESLERLLYENGRDALTLAP